MREFATYLGHTKLTIFIGLTSVLFSVLFSYAAVLFFHIPFIWSNFILAIIIPAIVAPSVSWFFLKIYFKLETMEKEMRQIATYDSLTGILRRQAFLDIGQTKYKRAQREEHTFSVFYLDLDDFKKINDTYGHEGGDLVLSFFGETLRKLFREEDVLGRLGGEEFAIFIGTTNSTILFNIIQRMKEHIMQAHLKIDENPIYFTVSIGISQYIGQKDINFNTLLSQADKALFKAKEKGKDCTYLYKSIEKYEKLTLEKSK